MKKLFLALTMSIVLSLASGAFAQEPETESDALIAAEDEEAEITPDEVSAYFQANYQNGYIGPTCPIAAVDDSMREAFQALSSAGKVLEEAIKETAEDAKRNAMLIAVDAANAYEDLLAVCRHELRKANKLAELKEFQDATAP